MQLIVRNTYLQRSGHRCAREERRFFEDLRSSLGVSHDR